MATISIAEVHQGRITAIINLGGSGSARQEDTNQKIVGSNPSGRKLCFSIEISVIVSLFCHLAVAFVN